MIALFSYSVVYNLNYHKKKFNSPNPNGRVLNVIEPFSMANSKLPSELLSFAPVHTVSTLTGRKIKFECVSSKIRI